MKHAPGLWRPSPRRQGRKPSPDRLLFLVHGHWAAAALATAVDLSLFTLIEAGCSTTDAICRRTGTSPRATETLLEALVALELLTVSGGRYRNAPEASCYLVAGRAEFLGDLSAALFLRGGIGHIWPALPDLVRSGRLDDAGWRRLLQVFSPPDYSVALVDGISVMAQTAAEAVARHLRVARRGRMRILDIGGGAGAFSDVLLRANRRATAAQVDYPVMNALARDRLAKAGLGDRFEAHDGAFESVTLAPASFDVIIYSNVAHFRSAEENQADLCRAAGLLRDGGTLVLNDYLAGGRRTHPVAPLAGLNWLFLSQGGRTWPVREVRRWFARAGLREIVLEPAPMITTLVYGRRRPGQRPVL